MQESANYVWMVVADHPVFGRPDKLFGTKNEAKDYADELASAGYENVSIDGKDPDDSIR